MNSRMEKYQNSSRENMSRISRNEHLYSSGNLDDLSRIKTNTNVSIISEGKGIDINKIKKYIYATEEVDKKDRISLELPQEEETVVIRKEEKDYDINLILERARGKRETNYEEDRHRKLDNTQIDILKQIKIKEENTVEEDDDITGPIDELNTQEKTIVDLIKNIQSGKKQKDLFDDLMGDDDDTVVLGAKEDIESTDEIKEMLLDMTQDLEDIKEKETEFTLEINSDIEKIKKGLELENTEELFVDEEETDAEKVEDDDEVEEGIEEDVANKSFYTNSISFDKSDFEGFEDLEKFAKKKSTVTKIAIFLVIILLLATIFLVVNFVFDLKII